jgi:hypothetical protein
MHLTRALGSDYPTGETLFEALRTTMLTNPDLGIEASSVDYNYYLAYIKFWEGSIHGIREGGRGQSIDSEIEANAVNFTENLLSAASNKAFCITQKGFIGFVPTGFYLDDLICVFVGEGLPCVVRPKGNGYQLIGECYIHGIIKGETLEGEDWPVEAQDIPLV